MTTKAKVKSKNKPSLFNKEELEYIKFLLHSVTMSGNLEELKIAIAKIEKMVKKTVKMIAALEVSGLDQDP